MIRSRKPELTKRPAGPCSRRDAFFVRPARRRQRLLDRPDRGLSRAGSLVYF
ncbi:hypothetical protein B8V81_1080 [Paenibacillus pasadenensis]|uniref:Uncharacterized protein n=1 Tax=Paenibacillus pasadenensis TaxID=217090 RepID=A0A2N5N924_9BACL|nr:hypothetical protein B8V81_1080 [Paenibacillus pasadenensis]